MPILYRGTTLEAYLEPSQRSTIEHFCKNNQQVKAVNNFRKKRLSPNVRQGPKYAPEL